MNYLLKMIPFTAAALSWTAGFMLPANAQAVELTDLVEKSTTAMQDEKWHEALDLNRQAVERYGGENAVKLYGTQFCAIYYRMGLCEMKLKQFEQAMRSFEICYSDFPTEGNDPHRIYRKLSLLKWGEAAMGAEMWQEALNAFTKFDDERDPERDDFPKGAYYINLAICYYKLGQLAQGSEHLEIAIRNRHDFPTPEIGIVAGFQELVRAAVKAKSEQALLDFIGKNRGELVIDPVAMQRYNRVLLKLAGDALAAHMTRAAIAVYQFVPSGGDDETALIKLGALALIHETAGNIRGAFAAYRQLEMNHLSAPNRSESLYQLVRTASLIGEAEIAREMAARLAREFPDSPRLAEIRTAGFDPPPGEGSEVAVKATKTSETVAAVPLPNSRDFSTALNYYQGRNYLDAVKEFAKISTRTDAAKDEKEFAAYYEAECLRKIGDLDGLANALETLGKPESLGPERLRQIALGKMWEAVRNQSWEALEIIAKRESSLPLTADQQAQVAYAQGLALENLGRPFDAMNAYNVAMTVDAGASEDVARAAALGVMRIHQADPDVQDTISKWGTEAYDAESGGAIRLREVAAVAGLFEQSLGAGAALPEACKAFLNYQKSK